ncbi:hypothetical protein ACIBJE_21310 [Micromonospora sp. NPDC050187]|uniref:hypothetical protein n=1 Tax=Micromonospora sp. NPDC050187 TaxID=3364277 RepID=UPI0037A01887
MATEDHDPDAVRSFWAALDSAWRDSGSRSAEEISFELQKVSNYELAVSTIRGWLDHNGLPRSNEDFTEMCLLLVGKERADELMGALQAARRASRRQRPAVPSNAPEPDGQDTPTATPPSSSDANQEPVAVTQTRRTALRPWHLVPLAVVLIAAASAGMALVMPGGEQSPEVPVPVLSPDRTNATLPAEAAPCPTQTITATSRNENRAHATFCPDRLEFLLYDDRPDGKSAVLVVRVNGKDWPPYFNSRAHATRSPDGSAVTKNPPKRVTVPLAPDATAEFRVCVAERNPDRTYPEDTCGTWTSVWPPRR